MICLHWQEIICQYFLGPQLCRFARLDDILKTFLHNQGWTEQCSDKQKILNCYQRCGNVRQIQGTYYFISVELNLVHCMT